MKVLVNGTPYPFAVVSTSGGRPVDPPAPQLDDVPLVVVQEHSNMQVLTSLNGRAQRFGLRVGQPVRDAHAMCEGLMTRTRSVPAEAAFLASLQRWASKPSPWVHLNLTTLW